jgi:hypothetical protein
MKHARTSDWARTRRYKVARPLFTVPGSAPSKKCAGGGESMIDPDDVAMRTAVASAFRDCGLPSDEDDVDDFLVALRTYNYVVERLDRRTGEE